MNSLQTTALDWSPAQRIAFRFCFCYFLLFLSLDLLPMALGANLGPLLFKAYAATWYPIVPWVGTHILHVKLAVDAGALVSDGVGDTGFEYVQIFIFLVLASIGTLVWTFLDRNRKQYRNLDYWLRVYIRYMVACVLLSYGLSKVIRVQYTDLGFTRLLSTYGDSTPFDLLWNFMGYSRPYTFFAGALEVVGAMLLFFRRTATLGALILVGVMLNVVMLNFSYDVPVKIGATHLLLLAIFLIAPVLDRLANVLVLNRATAPANLGPSFTSPRMRIGVLGLQSLIIISALTLHTRESLQFRKANEDARRIPIYGMYVVEEFSLNGEVLPSLSNDPVRWRKVSFGSNYSMSPMSIIMMDNSTATYNSAKYDAEKQTISIYTENGRKKNVMSYSRPDTDHLIVEGPFREDMVFVKLKIDHTKFTLLDTGFHWVNDQI
jgi:multidrug transporter EmrE-like cation transporter